MHFYKDYRHKVRKRGLSATNIIIGGDILPQLHHYLLHLDNLSITEGSASEYYGEVKKIVNSFIINWTEVMNNAIKEVDKAVKVVSKEELIEYVDHTIEMQNRKQSDFDEFFLPITTPEEKEAYDEIMVLYNKYIEKLETIRVAITAIRDFETMTKFAQVNFAVSLHKKNDLFAFTHTYIAEMLVSNIKDIDRSLHEIVSRTRNNLRQLQESTDKEIGNLLNQLYNKNKEHLALCRKPFRTSNEIAEVERSIDKLKRKIEGQKHGVLSKVEEEYNYWNDKLSKFKRIVKTVDDLNKIEQKVLGQKNTYTELRKTKIQANKLKCWEHMDEVFAKKLTGIDEKKREAAKALLSFFCIRGPDHIFYNDSVGRYYVDPYGHKVYVYDYGLKVCHVNCEGEFVESPDNEMYYYDSNGRYVLDANGEKVYKIAPCTSCYLLVNDSLIKTTIDCGHSEQPNNSCQVGLNDCRDDPVTPDIAAVDIKGKLDEETGLYLWDCFGHVLPEVLYEVARESPKNPIHCLAHKLLRYKYDKTLNELQQKKDEASRYRAEIYRNRKDKVTAAKRAWKAKQVQRVKSGGDLDTQVALGHDIARHEFINSLINFYT